jgi:hypothetical protein
MGHRQVLEVDEAVDNKESTNDDEVENINRQTMTGPRQVLEEDGAVDNNKSTNDDEEEEIAEDGDQNTESININVRGEFKTIDE